MTGLLHSLSSASGAPLSWRTRDWRRLSLPELNALTAQDVEEAETLLARWRRLGVSSHPWWPEAAVHSVSAWVAWAQAPRRVLAIDEATLSPSDLRAWLQDVMHAYPDAALALLPDPDAQRAHPDRCLPAGLCRLPPQTQADPWMDLADVVCTHSADAGMLALLRGRSVHTWGQPFYAGWGLTRDEQPAPPGRGPTTLGRLFAAVAVKGSGYADLARVGHGSLGTLLSHLALQQEVRSRFADLGPIEARGMARWKRPFLTPYLQAGGHAMGWQARPGAPAPQGTMALWGATPRPDHLNGQLVRVEDGFLRSAGLGSDLIAPWSLVIDRVGIYFDAIGGSELLDRLQEQPIPPALRERAAALRRLIVDNGVSKYNFARRPTNWVPPPDQKVVLLIGQVADDAAMRLGVAQGEQAVTTAEQLLTRVRAEQPEAYLVYKPHPDVLSGNRRGLVHAEALCDRVDATSDLISLIDVADEVHVISSLAGFDALLRGKAVVTHGLPFFAGWGLTTDRCEIVPARRRCLQLDELVAITLLVYPVYWDWEWGAFTTAEATVRHLDKARHHAPLPGRGQAARRTLTKTIRWLRNLLNA